MLMYRSGADPVAIRSSIEKLDKDFRRALEGGSLTRSEKKDLQHSFQKKVNDIENGYKDERAAVIRARRPAEDPA